ncbi:MAG: hypothetical protein KatS3mg009_0933 [Acidimicrobiia bacterium]|nr:MAG: hypothetical protein KatS3mg009_0933 [Acidimicrobiia bacterium]
MRRTVRSRSLLIAVTAAAALGWPGAAPAAAASFDVTCDVVVSGAFNLTTTVDQTIELTLSAPTEVEAGTTFQVTIPARTVALPADSSGIAIARYSNLSTVYRVTDGTPVPGSASDPSVTISGSDVTTFLAGPVPPGDLDLPAITFDVTAGAAGTTITTRGVQTTLRAHLDVIASVADTTCPIPATPTLSTTQVVEPPPPGAPDAVADTAQTTTGTPVSVDVLANDVPDGSDPIDEASLTVSDPPSHGSASVAGTLVTYVPADGFVGTDSFEYRVCSAGGGACDTARVTVEVLAAPAATTTTTAATAPSTTAAAPAELPRTGTGAGRAVPVAAVLAVAGAGSVAAARRRRS